MRLFPSVRVCVVGGALAAGGAWGICGAARAATGEPSAEAPSQQQADLQRALGAQQEAAAARERAAKLEGEGGQTFKSGAVQDAERDAAIHQAAADQYFARAGVPSCQALEAAAPAASPELRAAQERLDRLRASGGWAYKSGAVAEAEAEVARLTPPTTTR